MIRLSADLDPLRPFDPVKIGRYRLLGRLGSGGMGEVYLGRDGAGRLAAVKLVHDAYAGDRRFRARFAREVAIARSIRVPWSAAVMDADPDAPVPWLATEYITGRSLEKLVTANGPMAEPSAGVLASKLAEALVQLHALDVVHRDVKPSNVLIGADGPHLIDFGIARAADATAITQTGMVLGAPGFMSPEQALGADSGPASDVFSLAAVVIYAATGHGPFGPGASPVALLRRIIDEHPDLQAVPNDLRRMLEPCLAKDPASRPTAAELVECLTPYRDPGGHWPPRGASRMPPDTPLAPVGRVLNRRRLIRTVALGVVAAGGIAIGTGTIRRTTGGSTGSGPEPPRGVVRWTFTDPAHPGIGDFSFGAGVLVVNGGDRILALDPRNGRVRWRSPALSAAGGTGTRGITWTGDAFYAHDIRGLFALDAATGSLRWEQDGAEVLVAGESVLLAWTAGSGMGPGHELRALDPASGALRWRHPIPPGETVKDQTVGRTGGRLHVWFQNALTTFDATTGDVQWVTSWPEASLFGMAAHDNAVVVALQDRVVSLDAGSGAHRWTRPVDDATSLPVVHGDAVFVCTSLQLSALDADTGRPLWSISPRARDHPTVFFPAAPVGIGPVLHVIERPADYSSPGEICAYAVHDGKLRWSLPIVSAESRSTYITPLTATTDSVCFAANGTVYAVSG